MAVQTLDYFQRKWPGVKVWYMHPPMADEDDYLAKTTGTYPSHVTLGVTMAFDGDN